MDSAIPHSALDTLDLSPLCRIRNIHFCSQDLEPLLPGHREKITATTVDVFGAVIQQASECSESVNTDYCIFSSRIAALAAGIVSPINEESIEAHVLGASPCGDTVQLMSRRRWAIPLCGGTVSTHWVLGWLDLNEAAVPLYGITDSIPELDSETWAKPYLIGAIDTIRRVLNLPPLAWTTIPFSVCSPTSEAECQIDSWSCGIVVMIAMQHFAERCEGPLLRRSVQEAARVGALCALCDVAAAPPRLPRQLRKAESSSGTMEIDDSQVSKLVPECITDTVKQAGMLRTWGCRDEDSPDESEEAQRARSKKPCKSTDQRRQALEDDEWCHGCGNWISLHAKRSYELGNWEKHRRKCSRIIGTTNRRIAVKPIKEAFKNVTGPLHSFFQAQSSPRLRPASDNAQLSAANTTKRDPVHYETKKVSIAPMLESFFHASGSESASNHARQGTPGFRPSPSGAGRITQSSERPERACQHLSGELYLEYILRTYTRSLGGVSPRLRARVVRELFPYKPFPKTKTCPLPIDMGLLPEAPPTGNREVEERRWTHTEQRQVDLHLEGWARWEVNIDQRFVKSKRCSGTTRNSSDVCDACQELAAHNAGFRKSLSRKIEEAELPIEDQRVKQEAREKHTSRTFRTTEARNLQAIIMSDALTYSLWSSLERDDSLGTFLQLHQQARDADGAASELGAQNLMDHEQTDLPPLKYDYPRYGIHLCAPVFSVTGPLVSVQDPLHARKTCRNQPQHGTHTCSLGRGYLVNRSLLMLYRTGSSGPQLRDVQDVDKQDDGAARRLFHHMALNAMTCEKDGSVEHRSYCALKKLIISCLAKLFETWTNQRMTVQDRAQECLRARFFLHICRSHAQSMAKRFPDLYHQSRSFISSPSFHILNRLCDSVLLLILAFARYYPTQPFCPWLFGTEFVKHFFGLARSLLPDFAYAELLKLVKHVMLRQHILLSGQFKVKKERNLRTVYILDYDATPLTPDELLASRVVMPDSLLDQLVELAFNEACQIAKQLLGLPSPSLTRPLKLAPLEPPAARRQRKAAGPGAHDRDESDHDSDLSDHDEDDDSEEEHGDSNPTHTDSQAAAAQDSAHFTARYAALCDDFEHTMDEIQAHDTSFPPLSGDPGIQPAISESKSAIPHSKILDESQKIDISLMLESHLEHLGRAQTRSERVIAIDPHFALSRLQNLDKNTMTAKEGSHHVRVVQALVMGGKPAKTARELRWQSTAKSIQTVAKPNNVHVC
ncbi:hypothetical protein C8Q80DRAFT_1124129 [Daedaleopsis nitida]|nr:hypothetical protein C8Q80DRAFT_1124129 [Daedaleopsis nitida]